MNASRKLAVFPDGEAGIVEAIRDEYNCLSDDFTYFYTIRMADGSQCKLSSREMKDVVVVSADQIRRAQWTA